MKRRKLSISSPLPVDCVGKILSYVRSTKIFFKVYTLSKHVKWYIDEECASISCEHINFIARAGGPGVTCETKYAVHLTLKIEIPLRFFPRVKSLAISSYFAHSDGYCAYLPNLKNLQRCEITSTYGSTQTLNDSEMNWFSNLKEIVIGWSGKNLSDEGLKHLTNVEVFSIIGCQRISGECFKFMQNLREMEIRLDFLEKRDFFKYLGKLRKLDVSDCRGLQDCDLKYFASSKLECIKLAYTYDLTDACLQYIPKDLKEIRSYGNGISGRALSRFRDLVSVIHPPRGFEYSQFKNLRKYEILDSPRDSSTILEFFASIDVIPTELEELTFFGDISDDQIVLLKRFSNLKVLKLYHCREVTSVGMKTIAKNHKLKTFLISENDNITRKDLDLIRAKDKQCPEIDLKITM